MYAARVCAARVCVRDVLAMMPFLLLHVACLKFQSFRSLLEPVWAAAVAQLALPEIGLGMEIDLRAELQKSSLERFLPYLRELLAASPQKPDFLLLLLKAAVLGMKALFAERFGQKADACIECLIQQASVADLKQVLKDFQREPKATLERFAASHGDVAIILAVSACPGLQQLLSQCDLTEQSLRAIVKALISCASAFSPVSSSVFSSVSSRAAPCKFFFPGRWRADLS